MDEKKISLNADTSAEGQQMQANAEEVLLKHD